MNTAIELKVTMETWKNKIKIKTKPDIKIAKINIHSKDKTLYLQLLAKQFGLKYCLSFAELF